MLIFVSCSSPVKIKSLKLNKENLELEVGETEKLNLIVEPAEALTSDIIWSSSDEKIAIIDKNGLVSAVSPGLASVTAKAKDKDLLVQCDVTVTGKPVKSIKLNKTSLSLQEGSSEQLKVTIDPQDATNQTIKYTSNNTKIATVDSNGLVKGISKGSALITASSADGGFVSECKVNVNAKPEEAKPAPIPYKPTKPSSAPKGSNLLFSKKGGYMMVYVYRHIGAIE